MLTLGAEISRGGSYISLTMNWSGQTDILDDLKTASISVDVQSEVILAEFHFFGEFFEAGCVHDVTLYHEAGP